MAQRLNKSEQHRKHFGGLTHTYFWNDGGERRSWRGAGIAELFPVTAVPTVVVQRQGWQWGTGREEAADFFVGLAFTRFKHFP